MDYNPYEEDHPLNPSSFFLPNPISPPSTLAESTAIDRERGERLPQWTQAETRELLSIRAELDRSFTETKRNKALWEAISLRMQQQGFLRTPEQCKSKWKNLVTRYKGSEAMEGDRQFAFHEEMRSIFSERMDRILHQEKAENDVEEEEKSKKKRKRKGGGEIEEALSEFARKQVEMEMRWMEAVEAREAERRLKEEEWRREMIARHQERIAMERRWMEKEEERWAREEARDERRHAIITAILSKIGDD